jgi:hypothetical protein
MCICLCFCVIFSKFFTQNRYFCQFFDKDFDLFAPQMKILRFSRFFPEKAEKHFLFFESWHRCVGHSPRTRVLHIPRHSLASTANSFFFFHLWAAHVESSTDFGQKRESRREIQDSLLGVFEVNCFARIRIANNLADLPLTFSFTNHFPLSFLPFYLPHMEYEGSIGFVSRKMNFFYCLLLRFRTFYS